jgi:hypothetical protein
VPVVPPTPRFKTETLDSNITRITIPSRKNWFAIFFLGFWLFGWAIGEFAVLGFLAFFAFALVFGKSTETSLSFAGFGGLYMLVWLGVLTVGGGFVLYNWLWQIAGKEVIDISSTGITIANKIFSFSRPKEYNAQYIKELRVSQPINSMWSPWGRTKQVWGTGQGIIAFDYGAKTVRFGSGFDEAEAKMILSEITSRYPQYAPK